MHTFLNYLVVLAVAALLLGPSLYGVARERRIDRQLRGAAAGRSKARRAQKSSSRSTVPSTATW
ncbi:hypothetical protein [Streptomyces sp. NPDC088762]|uniref:hypothetical protein n=1 Tax=Streptomyces sp. NPDC088762 TaxID=3365891 RepID=UPI0037FEC554